jgi:hypothetical protein
MVAFEEKLNKILEAAEKKADSIAKQTNRTVKAAATPDEKEKAEHEAYLNERVPVYLFKDGNKYKDDVPVTVNGETILIQRGKHVMIKRKFAQVLENSQMQDAFATDHMTALANQYESNKTHLS